MTMAALVEVDRALSVAPTGSGKTVMAGEIIRRAGGRVLFLCDAQELVKQAADKLGKWAGVEASVEMADKHANPTAALVVATTQSIARRLDKYPVDAFVLIIVDEAHRNTLGAQAQSVFSYFAGAQVVGLTATPFRSDKKQLGHFYQTIAAEIGLVRLIREGWLSRISIKSVPAKIDLADVRTARGDYREDDLGSAIEPHLDELAAILAEHAPGRRTVAFLPLVATSRKFAAACRQHGLAAVHVDGEDRADLEKFRRREANVICNAQLLSTGWDEPSVDCVFILRPTKSFSLYSQMVGRGTRICEGKENLLVLDPLFLSDDHTLIKPARLIAKTDEEAAEITAIIERPGYQAKDLFEAEEEAAVDRSLALQKRMKEVAKRKSRTVDAVDFALALGDQELAGYEPETDRDASPMTVRQAEQIENAGFDMESVKGFGHASRIIDKLFHRRDAGLATPKQMKWLIKYRHPSPHTATFQEAHDFLDAKWNKKPTPQAA